MNHLERQVKVSKLLGLAFVLSISPLLGIGSLLAVILGSRALRMIEASNEPLNGRLLAWWCIVAGTFGTVIGSLAVAAVVQSQR
jgi:hypothetical protein